MPTVQEGELEFRFPKKASVLRFDGDAHGLSHCMKAVDFIVEFADYYLFVEVKDPQDSRATEERRAAYAAKLSQPAFPQTLSRKFRDSILYRWAEEKLDKPVRYVVLLVLDSLDAAAYLSLGEALEREIPCSGTPDSWSRPLAARSAVLSLEAWNDLKLYGSVRRV